ncbi:MAG: MBL fold metallo-hydrolase [Oligoflexia bacterium]|nr:MBL fold metallo-hydrolase [Oligoflexia bacterium]
MALVIESLRIGPEKNFCYLIIEPQSREAVLIDAAFEPEKVARWCQEHRVKVNMLLATHGHWDHCEGFHDLLIQLPIPQVAAHQLDGPRLKRFKIENPTMLHDGQYIKIGAEKIQVMHLPGHTEGGLGVLVFDEWQQPKALISGDTLFIGQCGRTDLPGGSDEAMFDSLQRIKSLPGTCIIYPGHDYGFAPTDTLAHQIETNPTLMAQTLVDFNKIP